MSGAPREAVVALRDRRRRELERLVAIPSISLPGFPREPVRAAAETTAELLREAGLAHVELLDVPGGSPAVWAEHPAPPGAPTVLLYAHYDVQPADREGWTTPPFHPVQRGGRLYGRGTADDKCGIVIHASTLCAYGGDPPVGVKVLVEGDEEGGGDAFTSFVAANAQRLAADVVVVADAGNRRLGEPVLTTSLRGLVELDLTVRTLRGAVHSGAHGGAAPDALMALAQILASFHDRAGNVAVDGLTHERWSGAAVDEQELRAAAGVLDDVALLGDGPLAERLLSRPAITCVGLDAPAVEGSVSAIVPAVRARISARVAPGQDPLAALQAIVTHIRRATPWGAELDVTRASAHRGLAVAPGGPVSAMAARALEVAYGTPAVIAGDGVTIPLCAQIAESLPNAEIVLWGAFDGTSNIHGIDESVDLAELERATLAQVELLHELGAAAR